MDTKNEYLKKGSKRLMTKKIKKFLYIAFWTFLKCPFSKIQWTFL